MSKDKGLKQTKKLLKMTLVMYEMIRPFGGAELFKAQVIEGMIDGIKGELAKGKSLNDIVAEMDSLPETWKVYGKIGISKDYFRELAEEIINKVPIDNAPH